MWLMAGVWTGGHMGVVPYLNDLQVAARVGKQGVCQGAHGGRLLLEAEGEGEGGGEGEGEGARKGHSAEQ